MSIRPRASSVGSFLVDKAKHFRMLCDCDLRQRLEEGQNPGAFRKQSTCEFSDYERMRQDFSVEEELAEPGIAMTEVVDLDRRVRQDHAAPDRRRGIGRNLFWEPPS